MSHRFIWAVVAAVSLGGLVAFLSQSSAQRPPAGAPGGPPGVAGGPAGPAGRFVVAHASPSQVLILDTETGQVYRAKEEDFKKMSDLPRPGGDIRGRRPEPRDGETPRSRDGRRRPAQDDEAPPPARNRRAPERDAPPPPRPQRDDM